MIVTRYKLTVKRFQVLCWERRLGIHRNLICGRKPAKRRTQNPEPGPQNPAPYTF